MSGTVPNTIRVSNQSMPANNQAKTLPYKAQLASATSDTLDLNIAQTTGTIDQVQAIFVDNSANLSSVSVNFSYSNMTVTIPPQSQGWVPVLSSNPPVVTFTSSGGVIVPVFLCNVPMPASVWPCNNAGANSTVTLTNRSTTSPNPAASTQLMAANTSRKYVMIKGPETADLWINPLGGTASVDGLGCFKIIAGGTYETNTVAWSGQINYFTVGVGVHVNAAEG